MKRKELVIDVAHKLRKVRISQNLTASQMAEKLALHPSTYKRNEKNETSPDILSLFNLGNKMNVSLDWLICDKGEMIYKEKVEIEEEIPQPEPVLEPGELPGAQEVLEIPENPEEEKTEQLPDPLRQDVRELVEAMEQIPLLRYEVLVLYHKFKLGNKELFAE